MAENRDRRRAADDDEDDDEVTQPEPEEADIVNITKASDDGRVGIWDRHPLHPPSKEYPRGGEIYLDQMNEVVKAHRSPGVNQKISEGSIRVVSDATASRLMQAFQRGRDEIEERRQQILREAAPGPVPMQSQPLPSQMAIPSTPEPPHEAARPGQPFQSGGPGLPGGTAPTGAPTIEHFSQTPTPGSEEANKADNGGGPNEQGTQTGSEGGVHDQDASSEAVAPDRPPGRTRNR